MGHHKGDGGAEADEGRLTGMMIIDHCLVCTFSIDNSSMQDNVNKIQTVNGRPYKTTSDLHHSTANYIEASCLCSLPG